MQDLFFWKDAGMVMIKVNLTKSVCKWKMRFSSFEENTPENAGFKNVILHLLLMT